jgi:hypothetical protein
MKKLTAVLMSSFTVLLLVAACSPSSTGSGGGGGGQDQPTAWPTKTALPERTLKPGAGGIPMQPGGSGDATEEVRGGADLALGSFNISMEGYDGGCVESLDLPLMTSICIANEGNRDAEAFSFTLDGTTYEVDGLASGEEECFEVDDVVSEVEIDGDNVIEETDEENNAETLPVPTPPAVCTEEP